MKKRYRITPPSNNYKNGSVLRAIGAGAYGLGEGILDTVTMGLTDNLTDKGFSKLQEIGGASEGEIRAQQGIKGITNAAGAVGTAIVAPTMLKSAVGQASGGVADTLGATGNEALGTAGEGLTQVTNMAMPFIGALGGSMGSGAASGIEMGETFGNGGIFGKRYNEKGPFINTDIGYDSRYSGMKAGAYFGKSFRDKDLGQHSVSGGLYGTKDGLGVAGRWDFQNPQGSLFRNKPYYASSQVNTGFDKTRGVYADVDAGLDFRLIDNKKTKATIGPRGGGYLNLPMRSTSLMDNPNFTNIDFKEGIHPLANAYDPGSLTYGLQGKFQRDTDLGRFKVSAGAYIDPIKGKRKEEQAILDNSKITTYTTTAGQDITIPAYTEKLRIAPEFRGSVSWSPNLRTASQRKVARKIAEDKKEQEKSRPRIDFKNEGSLFNTNEKIMNNKNYENYTFRYGGNIYSNGGFGDNNMNEIPVTQFGNGGTHEENPLGGIPQGVGANGKQNLVEEGELKVPDPRPQSEGGFFIVSADPTMKLTKAIAEQYDIPKKYVGKSVLKAAESILRKDSRREGDTIEQNSINIELSNFLDAHEELTAMKKAKEEGKFMEELAALEEKYPEYMQALMGAQEQPMEQPMDPSMGGMGQGMEQQMSPEEQAMMEQQMMAQQQGGMPQGGMPQGAPGMEQGMDPAMMGMPPEAMGMAYGGKMYEYGGNMYGPGGNMIKRADGSYSQRGLWDNIRANKGSGKEPTSQMLEQERRIKGNSKMYGGNLYETGGSFNNPGFEALPENVQDKIKSNSMNYGGNMYEYGSTMGNMYGMGANMYNLGDFMSVDNLDLNSQTQLTGGVGNDIIGLSEEEKKFDPANQFSYQKSLGTLAGQAAPIVGNLISGLLPPKEYDGSLGRISPVELERQQLGQRGVQIDQSFAQAQNAMQAAGGSGYMSNIGRLQNIRDTNTQAALTDIANKNTEIDALEQKLNLEVEKGNISQADKEFQLNEAAETAKAAALREAAKQTAQIATAGEQNKLAMMYNKMYAPNYNFDYQGNPFAGMFKKDQQTS